MRVSIMSVIIYGLMSFASLLHADLNLTVGTGKSMIFSKGIPFERVAAVGYNLGWKDMFIRPELGYFMDNSGYGKSSPWASTLLGFRATSKFGPELHLALGPAYLFETDKILGCEGGWLKGHYQFSLEGGIGLTGEYFFIGLVYKHLSSAGLSWPNMGRDFVMVQLRFLHL